jgi:hypothetical protein
MFARNGPLNIPLTPKTVKLFGYTHTMLLTENRNNASGSSHVTVVLLSHAMKYFSKDFLKRSVPDGCFTQYA